MLDIRSLITTNKSSGDDFHKVSTLECTHIAIHGFILWFSMALLMPIGLLVIRMSPCIKNGKTKKVLFYSHVILQMIVVVFATGGAVMALVDFENAFRTTHQKIGLVLYALLWVQPLIAYFRPKRGEKRRLMWYFTHWFLGTLICIVAMVEVYLGLYMYKIKTSKSARIWIILFTVQVSLLVLVYLLQDIWDHLKKQRNTTDDYNDDNISSSPVKNTTKVSQTMPL